MNKKIFLILSLVLLTSFGFLPFLNSRSVFAAEATLFLSPNSGTYDVGDTLSVKVLVNSGGGVGINAAESTINFSKDYLMVSKIDQSNSIFELWTTKPSFSNKDGAIFFGGGATSAYTGTAGVVFSVDFIALKSGVAEISFLSGTITAHDGKGTNIFSGAGSGSYTLKIKEEVKKDESVKEKEAKKEKKPAESKATSNSTPPSPEVQSSTHPEENQWYSNNYPEFSWKLLTDLIGVSLILTDNLDANPGSISDGVIESKKYEKIGDGIHYFHIKFQNEHSWGPITHRQILVDTEPPVAFNAVLDDEGDTTNPRPLLKFFTNDVTSGVKNYKIILDGKEEEVGPDNFETNPFKIKKTSFGSHEVTVVAVDQAGNTASSSLNFVIDSLKAPVIIEIPKTMNKEEDLIIRGTSFYSGATIEIYISKDGSDPIVAQVKTDEEGNWNYFHKGKLDKGIFEVWAKVIDYRGAESTDSTKHILTSVSLSAMTALGVYIILVLCIIIIVIVLILLYFIKNHKQEKRRILREVLEVKKKSTEIFLALHEEVDELMEYADKKAGLSESEKRVKNKLMEALDISEEFMTKEIEDVEKEIDLSSETEGKFNEQK